MRRVGLLVIGPWVAVFGLATPAVAQEPSPAAQPAGAPAETVCTVADSRLVELSGMVALADGGYIVENDSNDQAAAMRIFFLDSKCKLIRTVSYPAANPARDPEDLAVASDGTLWVADIGDNAASTGTGTKRETVALWKVPAGGGTPVIHRLTYPDGAHDAEALLFGPDDTPVIVTKEPNGTAQIYQPTTALQANTRQGVPLKNVGSWKPKHTGTANVLGATGQILVTGAAQSPDRKRIALRTYSDAYEWDVPDGDVVKAITKSEPRVTPLPNEPQGEAIAYSPDGKTFLTCSDRPGATKILRYQPASAVAQAAASTGKPAPKTDTRSWLKKLSLPQIIDIVAGVGVLGLVLVVVGLVGIQWSRRARRNAAKSGRGSGDDAANATPGVVIDPVSPDMSARGAPGAGVYGGGNVYGGAGGGDARGGGGVYGGGGASGVFGSPGSGSGGVYGRPGAGGAGGGVYGGGGGQGGAGGDVYGGGGVYGGGQGGGGGVYGGGRQEFSRPRHHPDYDDRY